MIHMSEVAQEKLRSIIESRGPQAQGVRLGVEGPGQYTMSLVEAGEETPDDAVLPMNGFKVFIDAQSAPHLEGVTVDFVEDLMGGGFKIENPNDAPAISSARGEPPTEGPDKEIWDKVQDLLDHMINPAVAAHGGHIELLDVKDRKVYIEMSGGCQGCGMASITLKHGIERAIMEEMPEVVEILDVTDHAGGTNPYYRPR